MTSTQNFRVNSFLASLAVKAPCVVVTSEAITLSGEQTVNSVAVTEGDRVLVKDQADASENGIWEVETSAWTRAGDFDGNRDVVNGTIVVIASTPLVGLYQLTATNPVVPGTTDLTFQLLSTLDLAGTLASTDNGEGASQIGIEDAGTYFTATDVEAALAELYVELSAGSSGEFEATLTGFVTPPSGAPNVWWHLSGTTVTLRISFGTATSNAVTMTISNLPAALWPATNQNVAIVGLHDNGADLAAASNARITTSGNILFGLDSSDDLGGGFTNSGAKGCAGSGMTLKYTLGQLHT